jgi:hypothetical protein
MSLYRLWPLLLLWCVSVSGNVGTTSNGTTENSNHFSGDHNENVESAAFANYSWTADMPPSRGFVMCSGKRHIRYIRRNIYLLRTLWGSQLPVAVAHCRELSEVYQQTLHRLDPTIKFIDLCEREPIFGLPFHKAQKVLQGFYCKIGALLKSPFRETILMDVDVAWLNRPELMFNVKGYAETGALFMRARMSVHDNSKGLEHSRCVAPLHLLKYFQSEGISVDQQSAREHLLENGINLYWQGIAANVDLTKSVHTDNIQDSSVVLVDKARHPRMLSVLHRYLHENFIMGYGDKELFWVAATVAREAFSFEPFASGQYGDCHGVMMHFDPSAETEETATPWYANAEFMVEKGTESAGVYLKELNVVGEYLHNVMTKPIRVTADMKLASMQTWRLKSGKTGCTCLNASNAESNSGVLPCVSIPAQINEYFLIYEWLTYSSSLNLHLQGPKCVAYLIQQADILNKIFSERIHPRDCDIVGCPLLPIKVVMRNGGSTFEEKWLRAHDSQICDPVALESGESYPVLDKNVSVVARSLYSVWNRPLEKAGTSIGCSSCGFKSIYLYEADGMLHKFPNLQTFIKKGLDFKDTVQLKPFQFRSYEEGVPLDSMP